MIRILLCLCLTFLGALSVEADAAFIPSKDTITDADSSAVAITGAPSDALLFVRCEQFGYSIFAGERFHFINKGERVRVITRFDQEPPVDHNSQVDGPHCLNGMSETCPWSLSTDGTAVFVPEESKARILEGIRAKNALVVRTFNYEGTPHDWVFDLAGATTQLSKLQCLKEK